MVEKLALEASSESYEFPPRQWHIVKDWADERDAVLVGLNGKNALTIIPPGIIINMPEDDEQAGLESTWRLGLWPMDNPPRTPLWNTISETRPLSITSISFQETATLLHLQASGEELEWLAQESRKYYFCLKGAVQYIEQGEGWPSEIADLRHASDELLLDATREFGEEKVKDIINPNIYIRRF